MQVRVEIGDMDTDMHVADCKKHLVSLVYSLSKRNNTHTQLPTLLIFICILSINLSIYLYICMYVCMSETP